MRSGLDAGFEFIKCYQCIQMVQRWVLETYIKISIASLISFFFMYLCQLRLLLCTVQTQKYTYRHTIFAHLRFVFNVMHFFCNKKSTNVFKYTYVDVLTVHPYETLSTITLTSDYQGVKVNYLISCYEVKVKLIIV